jgi:DNA-directed RNA polymerase specialized sigma24 family protein
VDLIGAYSNQPGQGLLIRQCLELTPGRPEKPHPITRQRQLRLPHDEVQQLGVAYNSGASIRDLATSFGIHRGTVSSILDRQGIRRRSKALSAKQVTEGQDLYRSGLSLLAVSEILGCSAETVRQALMRAGEPIRRRNGRI